MNPSYCQDPNAGILQQPGQGVRSTNNSGGAYFDDGSVGIGTNNPSADLDVQGDVNIGSSYESDGLSVGLNGDYPCQDGGIEAKGDVVTRGCFVIKNTQTPLYQTQENEKCIQDMYVDSETKICQDKSNGGALTIRHCENMYDGPASSTYVFESCDPDNIDSYVGINNDDPQWNLDIDGSLHATGDEQIDGDTEIFGNEHVHGDFLGDQDVEGDKIIKTGGTGNQVLMADGTVRTGVTGSFTTYYGVTVQVTNGIITGIF